MIQFACPSCRKKLSVNADAVGKRVRCPQCQTEMRVPAPSNRSKPPAPQAPQWNAPTSADGRGSNQNEDWAGGLGSQAAMAPMDDLFSDLPPTPPQPTLPSQLPRATSGGAPYTANPHASSQFGTTAPRPTQPNAMYVGDPGLMAAASRHHANQAVDRPLTEQQVRKAFSGTLPPHQQRKELNRNFTVVSLTMAALPIAYVGILLTIAILWFVYTFIIFPNLAMMALSLRRIGILLILFMAVPIPATLLMLLFMVKPVFMHRKRHSVSREITRESEPVLFALIEEVSRACNSPMPVRVELTNDVSAAARTVSLFGRDLYLVLGAPLIAGLTTRQLAGVISHEFGFFNQGAKMRASGIIRSVNQWFRRVVYERDSLDTTLQEASEHSENYLQMMWSLSTSFVFIGRGILWCLMVIGHRVSVLLLHEMEFDADQYESRVTGSKNFCDTRRELVVLQFAWEETVSKLKDMLRRGKLPDDLLRMLVYHRNGLDFHRVQQVITSQDKVEPKWYDSRPSRAARVAAVQAFNHPGVFTIDAPARALFKNFPGICRGMSRDFYDQAFGQRIPDQAYAPTDQLLQNG